MAVEQRPQIAIVVDDLGLDWAVFEAINALPGPVTMGFLPYGRDAQAMLDRLSSAHEAILHLPMEPKAQIEHAGPDMLPASGDAAAIRAALQRNLDRLEGYRGVNNHTGSRFTADAGAMELVLAELHRRELYFLDSVTTPRPASLALSRAHGWRVAARDVFLDPDYPTLTTEVIRGQLAELEYIAKVEGQAIGIAHPYPVTLEVLGPWLATVEARGFELVPVSALVPEEPPRPRYADLR